MFNRRVFLEENFEKMDKLFYYLQKKNFPYCVSFGKDAKTEGQHVSTVTWWGE